VPKHDAPPVNDFTYKEVTEQYPVVYEVHVMRTFIRVRDMGRAFLFALENADRMRGQVYNIGSDHMNFSKRDVCELIQKQVQCYVHYAEIGADADNRDYVVSYDKIKKLGFGANSTLEEGISEFCRGFAVLSFKTPYSQCLMPFLRPVRSNMM
jgi:nucleoside-diphosphate-sugar epimerase